MALPLDVLHHVVSFLKKDQREALGYDLDTCVRLKLPPAPLCLSASLKAVLTDLQRRRTSAEGVTVFDTKESVLVSINFARNENWLFPRFQMMMSVAPNIVLHHTWTDIPLDIEWVTFIQHPNSCNPRYYIFHPTLPEILARPHIVSITPVSALQLWRSRVLIK